MSNLRLAFVIDAVDKATATVTRVGRTIDRMTEPVRRVRASLNAMLEDGRMTRLRGAMTELHDRTQGVMAWGRGAAAAVAGVGLAATGAGFALKGHIDQIDAMNDQAKKLGMSVELYQRMGYAAQLNGSNAQEMGQALQFLAENMTEARMGSKETIAMFGEVGLSLQQLRKMNPAQVMEAIADKFAAVGDAGGNADAKIKILKTLMGRGGAELKQTLDQGSKGMREFYSEADRVGAVVSTKVADAFGNFNDSWDRMRASMGGATSAIAYALLPVVDDLVQRFTAWRIANQEGVSKDIAKWAKDLAPRLPEIAKSLWQIASALGTVIGLADSFAQLLGGWEVVLGIVAAVIATKLVVALYGMGVALWGVASAFAGVAIAFLATPFGMIVAGVAAVAAGAAVIYAQWKPIKTFFLELWEAGKKFFGLFGGGGSMVGVAPGAPSIYAGGDAWARYRAQQAAAAPGAVAGVAAAPSALVPRASGPRAEVGGTLRIEIDANGQPRVRDAKKAAGGVLDFDVYGGQVMAGS